jgi:hypothetical protein
MRIRPNSTLAKLTPDQLETIFDWIASGVSYRDVKERCAQPLPEGFDLHVNISTLWGFFSAERARRHSEALAQARYNHVDSPDAEQLMQNLKIELAHACYELANQPGTPVVINSLSRITHRLDRIKLDQQRVNIEEKRLTLEHDFLAEKKRQFNFNAAREAAKHAAKIHKVIETKGPDNEEKIWMVNDIVFGPPLQLPDSVPSTQPQ